MPKVGIISRKNYRNFGNALQAAALFSVVQRLGYDPIVADYSYHGWLPPYRPLRPFRAVARRAARLFRPTRAADSQEQKNPVRTEKFQRFLKRWTRRTEPLLDGNDLALMAEGCDAFISGSDQVFSPIWYDPHFCLDFVDDSQKKIAYAASFGVDKIEAPALRRELAARLADFASLSVREHSGQDLIRQLTGRDAAFTLDPTLLIDRQAYIRYEGTQDVLQEPYLLCYFLGGRPVNWQRARQLADAMGLKLAVIPYLEADLKQGDLRFPEAGPEDFLTLFRHAAYVCTDSFHGVAFSLIHHRPFTAFERNEDRSKRMSTRITSLLELAGAPERFIPGDGLDVVACRRPIDFNRADIRLHDAREASIAWLEDALAKACAAPHAAPWRVCATCCGCGACARVCPRGAISIRRNDLGFRVAAVDPALCVRCGKCRSVCPTLARPEAAIAQARGLYAFKAGGDMARTSSSGGFSQALGEYLAAQGIPMIGCAYDAEGRRALHRVAAPEDAGQRQAFRGSKYIQSDLAKAFAAIDDGLERALFVGTPCQTAAVARCLGPRRADWVLVDLICHGVPSDALYEKYLDDLDHRFHVGKAPEVQFRDQRKGWKPTRFTATGPNGQYEGEASTDPFMRAFLWDYALRDSCHECRYRQASMADLRIGDYWGPRYKADNEGVSMVAALTERGSRLVEALAAQPGAFCQPHPVQDYLDH